MRLFITTPLPRFPIFSPVVWQVVIPLDFARVSHLRGFHHVSILLMILILREARDITELFYILKLVQVFGILGGVNRRGEVVQVLENFSLVSGTRKVDLGFEGLLLEIEN